MTSELYPRPEEAGGSTSYSLFSLFLHGPDGVVDINCFFMLFLAIVPCFGLFMVFLPRPAGMRRCLVFMSYGYYDYYEELGNYWDVNIYFWIGVWGFLV